MAVGQVTPGQFVHREYSEESLCIRFISNFDGHIPSGFTVHTRIGNWDTGYTDDLQMFAVGQMDAAREAFKARMRQLWAV
ncbi:MAG: hypothetical protein WKG03_03650 [Telluria sp.]